MYEVLLLSLQSEGESCQVRVPVRACADALAANGAMAEPVVAASDQEIDAVLARVADGARLVVAPAVDAQLRAVVRRMVRRWAPPASQRPDDLPPGRTMPDLPPLAILPLDRSATGDLAGQLGLPREPAAVATAVLGDRVRRLDLFRQDGPGAVTLDGALFGSSDGAGRAVAWQARVEVDDAVLSTGREPLLAGVVANAGRYVTPDGLPLVTAPDPGDGQVAVAVALPVRRRWRRGVRVEVRRARGRAVTVSPPPDGVGCLDDGIEGELSRRRTWWVEPGAWGVYTA